MDVICSSWNYICFI